MKPVIFSLFNHPLQALIANHVGLQQGKLIYRTFPDGESYLRIVDELKGREIVILDSLDRPNSKLLPLLFLVDTLRSMGVDKIGLCASYLPYMRQDKQFNPGESVTSEYFSKLISNYFNWMITVDPHLHRHHALNEIYSIPSTALHAAAIISQWIETEIKNPILIGPDRESEQWVSEVALGAKAPYLILEKIRNSDHHVEVSVPQIQPYLDHTPVLVDDIISTAQTMIETVNHLKKIKMQPPVCIGIHAIFADNAYDALLEAGAEQVVTCNTISHLSNRIDLSGIIEIGIWQQLGGI